MTVFKSGDLVVLKSGGPTMTVDAVNTSIFDDGKITGVVCAWFVGQKLERFRFEPGALEPANPREVSPAGPQSEDCPATAEEYSVTLDSMTGAMNAPSDRPEQAEPTKAGPRAAQGRCKNRSCETHALTGISALCISAAASPPAVCGL